MYDNHATRPSVIGSSCAFCHSAYTHGYCLSTANYVLASGALHSRCLLTLQRSGPIQRCLQLRHRTYERRWSQRRQALVSDLSLHLPDVCPFLCVNRLSALVVRQSVSFLSQRLYLLLGDR